MDFVVLDTDPFLTTLHQLVHHPHPNPESDLERKIKRQRRESRDHEERRHVTIATPVDVKDNEDAYLFIADVPGLRKSDIEVLVENDNVLTMRGKRKVDEKEEKAGDSSKFIRMERSPVKLMRKFNLPSDAKTDGITAACVDGVLTVTVPRTPPPEPEKPKTIQISVT